ncbi:hypothetical protein EPR50_G00032420 [Perca flavescens]|uniref:Uncharacterized protein n=1 Tax=Perca flavescens TaxID=8167 RepID=A0A484DJW4_PERFV|nr:hypothetical protein EPR50_G00032420 [Perca flavescens]
MLRDYFNGTEIPFLETLFQILVFINNTDSPAQHTPRGADLHMQTGKGLYRNCVLATHNKTLSERKDMVWKDRLLKDRTPVWRVLYKPPLNKRSGDLQWRILHGALAVNVFLSKINPTVSSTVDQETSEVPIGQSAQQHQTHLDSIFMVLEKNVITFVKNELKNIQKVLSPDYPECSESQREDEDEQPRSSREAFLKITLHFLRRMKQDELADCLQSSKRISLKI